MPKEEDARNAIPKGCNMIPLIIHPTPGEGEEDLGIVVQKKREYFQTNAPKWTKLLMGNLSIFLFYPFHIYY